MKKLPTSTSPKFALLLVTFLTFQLCWSQNIYNVDSLNAVVYGTANDSSKLKALKFLAYNYMYSKPDSSKYYNDLMFTIAERSNSDLGYHDAYFYRSFFYWSKAKYDSSLIAVRRALVYAEVMKDTAKISNLMQRVATIYNKLGKYDSSEVITRKGLDLALRSKDWKAIMRNYGQLGNVYYYQNKFDLALESYLKVDSITRVNPIQESMSGGAAINIGNIFIQLENYEKAREYYERAKELYKTIKLEEGSFHADQKLAEVESYNGNYEKCIELLQPVKEFYVKIDDQSALASINITLGESHTQLNNYEEAEEAFLSALSNARRAKHKSMLANAYKSSGRTQFKLGKYRQAVDNLLEASTLYDETKITVENRTLLADLAGAYQGLQKYDSAYYYLQAHQRFKDTLATREKFEYTKELEEKYQTEKKEQEIELLSAQNQLTEEQNANQRNIFIAGGSVLTLGLIGLFFLYRNKQRTNTKLRELDTLKSNFFANISHEFRTPLTLISEPIQAKLEDQKIKAKDRKDFEMIQRNNDRLLVLVDQLLDLSKIDAGKLALKVGQNNLSNLLGVLADSFSYRFEQSGVVFEPDIEQGLDQAWFDPDIVEKIVLNLLSNAYKYMPKEGSVDFKAEKSGDKLVLKLANTIHDGQHLNLKHLFDRFYQEDSNAQGAGIGLALVKELVALHKGVIQVDRKGSDQIEFTINLPIERSAFHAKEMVETPSARSTTSKNPIPGAVEIESTTDDESDEKPILLVVEDNPDVQLLLQGIFKDRFNILIASNGEEGIETALNQIPDIVISDVMMPQKDGIALTQTLKADERTSHIPIVLLTAKAGEENVLKGIEAGADDYLVKPFSSKILKSKINKQVALRKQLQERYSQEVILKPADIAVNSVDEEFLSKVQRVLDSSLVESDFNTEAFSQAVGMSRMQLHRKLRALTGLSASEFIRSQRLKLAADLLKGSETNVSQVGYAVGFNDHSYFSKCFKEAYGKTPSEYAQKG